jgi:hypothetical protein
VYLVCWGFDYLRRQFCYYSVILRLTAPVFAFYALVYPLVSWMLTGSFLLLQPGFITTIPDGMGLGSFLGFSLVFIILSCFLLAVIAIHWHRFMMLGGEGPIFNRSVRRPYSIKAPKVMLIFIAVTFILLIFIRNFINLQGSEGFHDLLALVMMDLQDPTAITALNPLLWIAWFTKSVCFIWLAHRISLCLLACRCHWQRYALARSLATDQRVKGPDIAVSWF